MCITQRWLQRMECHCFMESCYAWVNSLLLYLFPEGGSLQTKRKNMDEKCPSCLKKNTADACIR